MLPTIGSEIAGHVVEGLVGRGGMGVVFRARQRRLGRTVALKTIAPELRDDANVRRRFLAEAVAAAALEHPNIVPVHDAGEADGVAYIVMRFVEGMDLHRLVRWLDPLTPAQAAHVLADVGAALDAMHAAGYVHRDVKPQNVLVARTGHVYLSDFGLARPATAAEDSTRPGTWAGTVNYVAPEQVCGAELDARTDVYALGGVLHFLLTGRPPYPRETDGAKVWAHLYAPPPKPSLTRPDVPAALDGVVARALAKDPADRFASAGALAAAAQRAAAPAAAVGLAVGARRPTCSDRPNGVTRCPTTSRSSATAVAPR